MWPRPKCSCSGSGIDLPVGVSEIRIIADAGADPEVVASDLLGARYTGGIRVGKFVKVVTY